MRVTIWGCRGSIAAPGRQTLRYGGNTSCVEVRLSDATVLVLDAGTGIRELGERLLAEGVRTVHVLLSHLHLDHLQGLAFFGPLYEPGVEVHLWGPPSPLRTLTERVGAYMSDPLFPVRVADVPCTVVTHDAPVSPVRVGVATLAAALVTHRGSTVGYRLEADGATLAYLPDHEPALGTDLVTVEPDWLSGHDLAREVDLLLHDAQYTADEYAARLGWGHSSVEHVVTFAHRTGARQLVLFHHDPSHTDDDLERLQRHAAALWGERPHPPLLAREGAVLYPAVRRRPGASAGRAGRRP